MAEQPADEDRDDLVDTRAPVGSWVLEQASDPKFPFRVVVGDELERVPVVALQRYGGRLSVVLDRPRQKRCDFQIVEKTYKHPEAGGPATYEQIFWSTQTAMRQRRPRGVRLHTTPVLDQMRVRIASDERYPWALGGLASERGPLPAGDYALLDGEQVLAVVERKTLD